MALAHDHPAYIRKVAAAKRDKAARLHVIFDPTQHSNPAVTRYGCYRCQYYNECLDNLTTLVWYADGWHYVPLRCFAEHPEFDATLWKMRR